MRAIAVLTAAALFTVASGGLVGCLPPPSKSAVTPTPAIEAVRSAFAPPSLDGVRLHAKNVDLALPKGCAPLGEELFVSIAAKVDDGDSELLAACNLADESGAHRVSLNLIRHRYELETGEDAAAELRRVPGVIDAQVTSTAAAMGQALAAEVVVASNRGGAHGKPGVTVYFGAHDGLYMLYAEIDGDAGSVEAWAETLPRVLLPTSSARPIRWRAPTKLAPSATAVGPYQMKLPEGVNAVPKGTPTSGTTLGDPDDPLAANDGHPALLFRDEAGFSVGGSVYHAKLLPPLVATPGALARLAAEARGGSDLAVSTVDAKVGPLSRVDATRKDGGHDVYAAYGSGTKVTVVHFIVAKSKWATYAPWIAASLASLEVPVEPAY
ncbi:MAG: hypothetical protein JNL79_34985 [Myxococcales bacterium]|nr:hypothetical protein [Myxococcales bacterium]